MKTPPTEKDTILAQPEWQNENQNSTKATRTRNDDTTASVEHKKPGYEILHKWEYPKMKYILQWTTEEFLISKLWRSIKREKVRISRIMLKIEASIKVFYFHL